MAWTLAQLAQRFEASVAGDAQFEVCGVCALDPGIPDRLGFLADPRHRAALDRSQAGAVVIAPAQAGSFNGNALVARDPALLFARIAALFDDAREISAGVHASAVVDATATVAPSAGIGPMAVIEAGAQVGAGCFIGPHCVVRKGAVIGDGSRLESNVYVGPRCRLGQRAHVLPGAVIGGRGFGLARSPSGWEEVPQLGIVRIGNDVEIGANTCIDRGALDDTVIGDGVKLDNHIQIAHNCRVGDHTAVAACVGIAGSTVIGKRCMIGGAAGIGGHLTIADDVVVLGRAMVTKSLTAAGAYGSGLPVMPVRDWRRLIGKLRRIGLFEGRIGTIEKALKLAPVVPGDEGERDDSDAV